MNNDILKNFVEQELNDHNKRNNAGLASVGFFDGAKTEEVTFHGNRGERPDRRFHASGHACGCRSCRDRQINANRRNAPGESRERIFLRKTPLPPRRTIKSRSQSRPAPVGYSFYL